MRKFAFDLGHIGRRIICLMLVLVFVFVFSLLGGTSRAADSEGAGQPATTEEAASAGDDLSTPAPSEDKDIADAGEAPTDPAPSEGPANMAVISTSPSESEAEPASTPEVSEPAQDEAEPSAAAPSEDESAGADAEPTAPAGADTEPTAPAENDSPALAEQTIHADADGYRVAISGMMPEGAKIKLTAAGGSVAEKVADATGTEGDPVFAYDIKIIDAEGGEWQPEELDVNVSISGLELEKNDEVTMLHVLDDPEATDKAVAAGKARMVSGTGIDGGNKVAVTAPSISVDAEQGTVRFSTDSFSLYIIVTGTTSTVSGSETVAVDGTLTLKGHSGTSSSWTSDSTSIATVSGSGTNATVTAVSAGTTTIRHSYRSGGTHTEIWTITVTDQIGPALQALNAVNNYKMVLAVLNPSETTLPGEPGISGLSYDFVSKDYSGNFTAGQPLANSAAGYISTDIYTSAYVQGSVDGSNTVGVVDSTGVKTKALLQNIDWDKLSEYICDIHGLTDSSQYEVIPYVIKLQLSSNEWHVDCRLAKKANISLTYDLNIATGVTVNGIVTPSGQTGDGLNWTVAGSLQIGSTTRTLTAGSTTISSAQGYTLTFQGWKDQDGKWKDEEGNFYYPAGQSHSFTQNTVLSAQWTYSPAINTGYLDIKKLVTMGAGSSATAPANDTFNFTVTFGQSGTYSYVIYNAAGSPTGVTGSFTGTSGSVTLSANQFARFQVPSGTGYSVAETQKEYYTPSWSNQSGTVAGGSTVSAVCTNTYGQYNYHVYYYVDGVQTYDDTCTYGHTLTIRGNESREGYEFSGWTLHQGSINGAVISTAPATMSNYDIYAVGTFTIKTYTIHYHADRSGSADYATQNFTINSAPVTLAARNNDGVSYTLHGWYTNAAYTAQLGAPGSQQTYAALVALDTNSDKAIDLYGYTTYTLTVQKTGGRSGDTFIFDINGSDGASGSFTITGNGHAVLTARYGVTYTVAEKSGAGSWSWRYAAVGAQNATVTGDSTITVANNYTDDHWLGDVAHVLNNLLGITSSAS